MTTYKSQYNKEQKQTMNEEIVLDYSDLANASIDIYKEENNQ